MHGSLIDLHQVLPSGGLWLRDNSDFNLARVLGSSENLMCGKDEIFFTGFKNIGYKLLWVAIDKWEP